MITLRNDEENFYIDWFTIDTVKKKTLIDLVEIIDSLNLVDWIACFNCNTMQIRDNIVVRYDANLRLLVVDEKLRIALNKEKHFILRNGRALLIAVLACIKPYNFLLEIKK